MRLTKDEKGRVLEIYTLKNGSVLTATLLNEKIGKSDYLYQLDGNEIDINEFQKLLNQRVGE